MNSKANAKINEQSNTTSTTNRERTSLKAVTDKLSSFFKRFSRDAHSDALKDQSHQDDSSTTTVTNANNSTNAQNPTTPTQKSNKTEIKFTKQSQEIDEEFMTSALLGPLKTKPDTQLGSLDTHPKHQFDDCPSTPSLNLPFQYIAFNVNPKHLLQIIQDRLESHKSEYGNRVRCVPSVRTVNCQHHCVALLACRLFAILCNEQIFQHKLVYDTNEVCFNMIVDILNPNNDPVNICRGFFYHRRKIEMNLFILFFGFIQAFAVLNAASIRPARLASRLS
jgi:hypothetical protein